MGNKDSKEEGASLKEVGAKANKDNPGKFVDFSPINLTNDIIVSSSKENPDMEYKKLNLLGEGSFAAVYRVQNKLTNIIAAMKVMDKSSKTTEAEEKEIFNEINILRAMDHPNILKIFEFYSSQSSYCIVTELCPGGELFKEIINKGPFDEKFSAYIMYQIFSAINYCHKLKIMHRDLKPENILIVDKNQKDYPTIKICDFGTSIIIEKGVTQKKIVGSSYYIAPEVLKRDYNEKCDIWSCGVIMYILLSGRPPFGGKTNAEIKEKIAIGKYDLESSPFDKLSKNALDLIRKLLEMNADKRISAEQALNHPWFKDNKSKELFNEINDQETVKKLIENLKNYRKSSVIQETALAYIIHNFPQVKDVVNACKLFNQIDTSGDGQISQAELLKGLSTKIKSDTLEKDVDAIFKKLDMDKNGYIGYEEFVRAAVSKEYFANENTLKFAFRFFDKDNSGTITLNEIEDIFGQGIANKKHVHDILTKIMKEVDVNGDGKISFLEFEMIMKKML